MFYSPKNLEDFMVSWFLKKYYAAKRFQMFLEHLISMLEWTVIFLIFNQNIMTWLYICDVRMHDVYRCSHDYCSYQTHPLQMQRDCQYLSYGNKDSSKAGETP